MTEDVLDFEPGTVLRGTPYRVVRRIGAGGMGAVFEVEHVRLKKRLMAKTLHPGLRARQDFVTRMEVEAQTLARIAHPNIVQVHDLGVTDDGIPFFVMEKLEGSDLRKLLRARRYLDLPDALTIVEDVLEALAHAHREGVVHRDIKPENIFLARSGAETVTKILDFGIVHVMDDSKNLTGQRFLGTCQYAAPEQLQGDKPSEKTDIYAVGCMLFELVAGRRPFLGPTTREFIGQHLNDEAPRLASIAPGVPAELDALVASALEKDPTKRPAGALWFASQLHRIQLSAASVVLAEANTTEEMLLTAITEGVASSNPLVAAAAEASDTDRDPGLAAELNATTPEPRRGATEPLHPRPAAAANEEDFRRARTRTGKPVEHVKTEELPEDRIRAPVERTPQPGRAVQPPGRNARPGRDMSSVVLPMRSVVPQGPWARRAIIASPVVLGVAVASYILVHGLGGPTTTEPAAAPQASSGASAGAASTLSPATTAPVVAVSPAAASVGTAPAVAPASARTPASSPATASGTSRARAPASVTPTSATPSKALAPVSPTVPAAPAAQPSPSPPPAPPPPRDDMVRTL